MKSVLVDIDHTVSNAFWRDGMQGVASWDEYHLASAGDEPLHVVVDIVRCLYENGIYNIIGWTARPEKFRSLTSNWCIQNDVRFDELLMRPDANFRPAPEIKLELLEKRFKGKEIKDEVAFALEDRDDVCAMLRGLGITVLQVFGRGS